MYDIVIIGGGINGCGVARDAAGRGLSVLLAEKGDLAGATSSASTKLIHGGLRYLEQFRFRLVRESLKEREVLLRIAPHVVEPLRFVLPLRPGLRAAPFIRLGLFLYDRIGGRQSLPPSAAVDLSVAPAGRALRPGFRRGVAYSDCRVDDARLVVLNALDAAARGADIRVHTEAISARRLGGHWQVELRDAAMGRSETVAGRVLVNAGGARVAEIARRIGVPTVPRVRLVKGSHIVVPRMFGNRSGQERGKDWAYILQNADRRVVFAIPWERDFTLIGTTDVDFAGDPAAAAIGQDEVAYLCAAVNAYFAGSISSADVVWSFAGVRALCDDGTASPQEATRDYMLHVDGGGGRPPLISVIGGKITTYRRLAEEAMQCLAPEMPHAGRPWTGSVPLPGGDFAGRSREEVARNLLAACPALEPAVATRLAAGYGTLGLGIFAGAKNTADLGQHFGGGLYEREVVYVVDKEWARTADDILWRRTKLGLHFNAADRSRLSDWLARHAARQALPAR